MLASRFALVGAAATVLHIAIAYLLIDFALYPALLANFIAFVSALCVSFTGHYVWTFRAPGNPVRAMRRFYLVSGAAFAVNNLILAGLLKLNWFSPEVATVSAASIVPAITFGASRVWAFSPLPSGDQKIDLSKLTMTLHQMLQAAWHAYRTYRFEFLHAWLLGVLAFFLVVGPRALFPTNIAWLGGGDPATHFLGWHFFRNSDWSFPIGLNPNYGLEFSNAIIFSDSNPLLAFLFKLFKSFLPETFQYFGIWLLVCFIFQALFAGKLLDLVTDNPRIRFLGIALFLFSPPMLWRLHGHFSLVGHFLILAALYLSLRPPKARHCVVEWSALLTVAAMVHAYLLSMVALLWATNLIKGFVMREREGRLMRIEFGVVSGILGLVCWQVGYFNVGGGITSGGYGLYRMNLLSFVDPSGWSYLLRDIAEHPGEGEGFNFLGLGVIVLLLFGLPSLLAGRVGLLRLLRKHGLLLLTLTALFLFALSNKVGIGPEEIDLISLPEPLLRVANTFRASGRMFWPVFYVLLLGAVFIVVKGNNPRVAGTLLGIAVVIQITDTSAAWLGIRNNLMMPPASDWMSPLHNPFWNLAAAKYDKLRWLYPANKESHWQTLAAYAAKSGMATDAVYLARVDGNALDAARRRASLEITTGRYDVGSLYVLDPSAASIAVKFINSRTDLLAIIDGLYVIAPEWKVCEKCLAVDSELRLRDVIPPAGVADRLEFVQSSSSLAYLGVGWSGPEPWGTWSDGGWAEILIPIKSAPPRFVHIEAEALVSVAHPNQTVEVTINSVYAGKYTLTGSARHHLRVELPEAALHEAAQLGLLRLGFKLQDAVRPVDIGINGDTRRLALGLVAITLQ